MKPVSAERLYSTQDLDSNNMMLLDERNLLPLEYSPISLLFKDMSNFSQ